MRLRVSAIPRKGFSRRYARGKVGVPIKRDDRKRASGGYYQTLITTRKGDKSEIDYLNFVVGVLVDIAATSTPLRI